MEPLSALELKDGDSLIISHPKVLMGDGIEHLRTGIIDHIKKEYGINIKLIVLEEGVNVIGAIRKESD